MSVNQITNSLFQKCQIELNYFDKTIKEHEFSQKKAMVIYYFSYNQYTSPLYLVEPNRKWKMSIKNYFIWRKIWSFANLFYMVVLLRLYLTHIYMQLWIYNKINILQIHAPKNTVWTFAEKDSVVEGKRGSL